MYHKENYGKCIENPVNLNSIPASMIFLKNLVTDKGLHIVFHRTGSKMNSDQKHIDQYEIMSTDGHYEDIYINIYNELSTWIPPTGFLFESLPDMMCDQLMKRENLEKLDEEDLINFDDKYVFTSPGPVELEAQIESNKALPLLERGMLESYGTNTNVEGFPFTLIAKYFLDVFQIPPDKIDKYIADIQPRM